MTSAGSREESQAARGPGRPRPSLRWMIAGVVAVLVAVNVIDNQVAHASLVAGPVGAAGLLLAARRAGLSWPELGLARDNKAVGSAVGTGTSGTGLSVLGSVLFR